MGALNDLANQIYDERARARDEKVRLDEIERIQNFFNWFGRHLKPEGLGVTVTSNPFEYDGITFVSKIDPEALDGAGTFNVDAYRTCRNCGEQVSTLVYATYIIWRHEEFSKWMVTHDCKSV